MEYGYIRVSTLDQNEDRQRQAMAERGVPRERVSGAFEKVCFYKSVKSREYNIANDIKAC